MCYWAKVVMSDVLNGCARFGHDETGQGEKNYDGKHT